MKKLAVCITAGALIVGACGGDDGGPSAEPASEEDRNTATTVADPTTTSTSTTAVDEVEDAVEDYFTALASTRLDQRQQALEVVEPGSPAELYARYLVESARLAPGSVVEQKVSFTNNLATLCDVGIDDPICNDFAEFRVNDAGQLVTFSAGGNPLSDRIVGGGGPVVQGAVTTTRVVSYQAILGNLFVLLDISNAGGSEVMVADYEASHIAADGRQTSSSSFGSSVSVAPGASAFTLIVFEQTPLNGVVRLPMFTDDFSTNLLFEIPVT